MYIEVDLIFISLLTNHTLKIHIRCALQGRSSHDLA